MQMPLKSLVERISLRTFDESVREPRNLLMLVALLASGLVGLIIGFVDPTVGISVVLVVIFGMVAVSRPLWLYVATLAQLSLLPAGGYMFGLFVPQALQFLVPALALGVVLDRMRRRDWGLVTPNIADWCLLAFLVLGYVGIFMLPGGKQHKYYTNQVVFPVMLYFVTRWLHLDRQTFLLVIKVSLAAASVMVVVLALTPISGTDPIYRWERGFMGVGTRARGPIGSVSDTAAYAAFWLPLFVYAAAALFREHRLLRGAAFAGCVATALAALGTHERVAVIAVLAGLFGGLGTKRGRPLAAAAAGVLGLTVLLWLNTAAGARLLMRLQLEDPMLRRQLYVRKAVRYIGSSEWNVWLGTGFDRLADRSMGAVSETEYVWDPSRSTWRSALELSDRPIHCAPLNLLGEYGALGVACLVGVLVFAGLQVPRIVTLARRTGRAVDWDLLSAFGACALVVAVNGLLHNTDKVHQVAAVCWCGLALIIGHPGAFLHKPITDDQVNGPLMESDCV